MKTRFKQLLLSIVTSIVLFSVYAASYVSIDRTFYNTGRPQDSKLSIDTFAIWLPREHSPTIAQPGEEVNIEIMADELFSESEWTAKIVNDFQEWKCDVKTAKKGFIQHGTTKGWILTLHIPRDAPPELMTLVIKHSDKFQANAKRSVHLVQNLEQDFYILHQSDQHLTEVKAVEPGGKAHAKWGNGSQEALRWLSPVINLINPRLLLQTGDNMHLYNEADSWSGMEGSKRRVDLFFDGLSTYEVPTVLATGNHDLGFSNYVEINEWRDYYNRRVGARAFSFKMGSMYVLSSEWTADDYQDWAKKDYLASWNDESIKYRLLISHFYDGLDAPTTIAPANKPADLLLVGHIHRTRILQIEPYPVLSVAAAQDHQKAAFFNFERTDSGWKTDQLAQHAEGINVHRLLGEYGKPTVSAEYAYTNDGTEAFNTVQITNTLPLDFYDGRIRFVMKKGKYVVDGGEILSQYPSKEGDKTIVLVKVNIKGNTDTTVRIKG